MASINSAILDLKHLERLALGESTVHRLDARAKVLVTFLFIICIVSYSRYELTALCPFFLFPAVLIARSNLPLLFISRKLVLITAFVLPVSMFNPLFDREILIHLGSFGISGGWISFASILVRSMLTVGAAFILVGTTGFTAICRALRRLGMPQVFSIQLLFLYRYMFVLAEESDRASLARELRSCGTKGQGIASFSSLMGHLLLRTWQRAERIHSAMQARGFSGELHAARPSHFGTPELSFCLGWSALFIVLRMQNVSLLVGNLVTGIFA